MASHQWRTLKLQKWPNLQDGVTETGALVPCSVKPGDRVLLPKWGGSEEDVHGIRYSVVRDKDLLCIIGETEEVQD